MCLPGFHPGGWGVCHCRNGWWKEVGLGGFWKTWGPCPCSNQALQFLLSYILRWCPIFFHARIPWLLVFEKPPYHIMEKEYILGDRRLTQNPLKLLHCLKFDRLDIHLANGFLLRYHCPWEILIYSSLGSMSLIWAKDLWGWGEKEWKGEFKKLCREKCSKMTGNSEVKWAILASPVSFKGQDQPKKNPPQFGLPG